MRFQYLPQLWSGMDFAPFCDYGLFVDCFYRAVNAKQYAFNDKNIQDGEKRDRPLKIGIIAFYSEKELEETPAKFAGYDLSWDLWKALLMNETHMARVFFYGKKAPRRSNGLFLTGVLFWKLLIFKKIKVEKREGYTSSLAPRVRQFQEDFEELRTSWLAPLVPATRERSLYG